LKGFLTQTWLANHAHQDCCQAIVMKVENKPARLYLCTIIFWTL